MQYASITIQQLDLRMRYGSQLVCQVSALNAISTSPTSTVLVSGVVNAIPVTTLLLALVTGYNLPIRLFRSTFRNAVSFPRSPIRHGCLAPPRRCPQAQGHTWFCLCRLHLVHSVSILFIRISISLINLLLQLVGSFYPASLALLPYLP